MESSVRLARGGGEGACAQGCLLSCCVTFAIRRMTSQGARSDKGERVACGVQMNSPLCLQLRGHIKGETMTLP